MSLTGIGQIEADGMPLHASWWQVMKPSLVKLPNGQPGYEIVHSAQTQSEAAAHAVENRIGGALIVLVFVAHKMPAAFPARAILRKQ